MKIAARFVLALGAVLIPVPAQAALLDEHFGAGACYSRIYGRAHLASHPDQLVTEIHLGTSRVEAPSFDGPLLEFGFTLRGGNTYSAIAYCEGNRCGLEGDGGNFTLGESGEGLRLEVGSHLGLEGATDFSPDLAQSDDTVFLLYRAKGSACAS